MKASAKTMAPVIDTRSGKLEGRVEGGIAVFKGVRFAAPPFGPRHLQPPQPVEPWNGVRAALEFGPKAPQVALPADIGEAFAELVEAGEDCLSLNVWTADLDASQPVMVWIAGGMFEFHATGATAYYDGSRFARDGVVCVTINHRVGAEGFWYLGDGTANVGLLDQIAALQWVQDNIAAFGGDPRNVTLFGQSAGAMSIATLLATPRAKGLFHRAVVQSGNVPHVTSAATAKRIGRRLAELLRVEPTRAALAALAPERILEAQAQLRAELQTRPDPTLWGEVALSYLPWAPTVDGEILPQRPIDAVRAGATADVDLLVGSNVDETRLFFVSDGSIDRLGEDALQQLAAAYGLPHEGLRAYRAAYPAASPGELFSAIQTDWYWRFPAARLADAHASTASAGTTTHMYEFAWRSPVAGGRLGAAHGLEMPFVFDTLGFRTEPMLGPEPPQSLADEMHRAWVSFAARGDCGWPRYDAKRRRTMRFDATSCVVENPLGERLGWWARKP